MTQPSKGAAAFLTLFGLPFAGAGLAFIYAQIVSRGNFRTIETIAAILFGSVFVSIGGGFIFAAFHGYTLLKQQAARVESNPLSPWLWRTDWASRRAESQNRKSQITYWVICIFCNMVTLPVVAMLAPNMVRASDPRVFVLLGFSFMGLILLVNALRATIRHRRFGDTYFEFDALPFLPGQHVSGRIHLKFETRAEHGIDLKLSCVRKIVSGTGDSRSTTKVVLWQADQNVPAGAVQPGPLGRAIPVDFSVPADSSVTDLDNPNDQVLWVLHAPTLFFILFGLSDVLIIAGFLHTTFGSSRIGARSGEILSCRGILGLGRTRRFQVSEVVSILPVVSMQQGGNSDNALHAIRMRLKNGSKITLADEIAGRQEARWVVSQIETWSGMKLDTHVEVDLPLGVPLTPVPQQPGQTFTQARPRASTAVSIGVFFAMVLGMFGFMAWRMTSFTARTNNSRTVAAARTKPPVARRVFSALLTDADVERVRALPAQVQAEELLERAIGHDTRALELFDELVDGWRGRIRMSDRMKQLERRSEFSKDLRVRYANADINLVLEGWQKNQEAVDLLIQRAQSDPRYRAWAVYYLGMLAGRGVDYERIHGVLLNYARNDKDPTVRQWAVEGMRFLAKDEVIDELFTSFTEDPATAVRDRAGCNISDCGIFTRKQRMTIVPKLLDLAMNPRTTGQMRSWTFLALQEITDEHLPADALAWSRWYQEHGSEKMAEVERLDWWQVRGDE